MAQVNVRNRPRKDGSNNWEYRFETAKIGEKRKRISKAGFKTKAEALREGIKAFEEYNNSGQVIKSNDISMADYLDLYMNTYVKSNVSMRTAENYESIIRNHIKPVIGQYKLQSINPKTLNDLLNNLNQKGYAHSTVSTVHMILSAMFKYAVYPLNYIKQSPMAYVKTPKPLEQQCVRKTSDIKRLDGKKNGSIMGNKPHIYITNEWMDKLFERFPEGHVYYIPLKTGQQLGARIGEVYALTIDDFNLEEKTVNIHRQVQWNKSLKLWFFKKPKYDSVRTISLSDSYVDIIKHKIEQIEKDKAEYAEYYTHYYENDMHQIVTTPTDKEIHFLNVRSDGTYINMRTMVTCSQVIHHDMGFKEFDFHSLRHTHATNLAMAHATPKYVQHRLGHKSIKVTLEIYEHLEIEAERRESDILNLL